MACSSHNWSDQATDVQATKKKVTEEKAKVAVHMVDTKATVDVVAAATGPVVTAVKDRVFSANITDVLKH